MMRAALRLVEGTLQSELSKVLGLSRTTVNKMVRRLMELGLVSRERAPRDRRTFIIRVTDEGMRRMRRTWARIAEEQPFQKRYEEAFGERSEAAVQNLNWALRISAVHIGDRSCEFYPSRDPDFSGSESVRSPARGPARDCRAGPRTSRPA